MGGKKHGNRREKHTQKKTSETDRSEEKEDSVGDRIAKESSDHLKSDGKESKKVPVIETRTRSTQPTASQASKFRKARGPSLLPVFYPKHHHGHHHRHHHAHHHAHRHVHHMGHHHHGPPHCHGQQDKKYDIVRQVPAKYCPVVLPPRPTYIARPNSSNGRSNTTSTSSTSTVTKASDGKVPKPSRGDNVIQSLSAIGSHQLNKQKEVMDTKLKRIDDVVPQMPVSRMVPKQPVPVSRIMPKQPVPALKVQDDKSDKIAKIAPKQQETASGFARRKEDVTKGSASEHRPVNETYWSGSKKLDVGDKTKPAVNSKQVQNKIKGSEKAYGMTSSPTIDKHLAPPMGQAKKVPVNSGEDLGWKGSYRLRGAPKAKMPIKNSGQDLFWKTAHKPRDASQVITQPLSTIGSRRLIKQDNPMQGTDVAPVVTSATKAPMSAKKVQEPCQTSGSQQQLLGNDEKIKITSKHQTSTDGIVKTTKVEGVHVPNNISADQHRVQKGSEKTSTAHIPVLDPTRKHLKKKKERDENKKKKHRHIQIINDG